MAEDSNNKNFQTWTSSRTRNRYPLQQMKYRNTV